MLIVCTCIKNVMGILFGPLAFFLFRRLMLSLTLESEMLIFLIEVNGNGPFSRMLFLSSLVNMDASCSFNMFAFFLWCFCYLPFSFTVCPLLCIITCSCYDHVMIVIHINILYSLKAVDCLLFLPCFKTCLYINSLFPCVSFALSSLSSAVQSLFLHCLFGNPCVHSWRVGNELTWSCRNSLVLTQVYHGVINLWLLECCNL